MASLVLRSAPALLALALAAACGSNAEHPDASASGAGAGAGAGTTGSGAAPTSVSASNGTASSASASSAASGGSGAGGAGGAEPCQSSSSDDDFDGDGFSPFDGDCNDCDADMNPGAIDIVSVDDDGNPLPGQLDEDCDGLVTMPGDPPPCDDAGLVIDDADPLHAAAAIELCQQSNGVGWGVLDAAWVQADGTPAPEALGHGILPAFGPNVQPTHGERMLALSSGTARQPSDPGYQSVEGYDKAYGCASPPGYPVDPPSCAGIESGEPRDSIALRVEIKVPTNANGFAFGAKFYTAEYPTRICTSANDFAVVFQTPPPAGAWNGNILFDNAVEPVGANTTLFEVCAPGVHGGKDFLCPSGEAEIVGTGYDLGAATTWLTVTAPIEVGDTVTLDFAVADAADGAHDSTLLLDAFRWLTVDPKPIPGEPVDDPK